jgi:hypothetical protein
VSCRLPRVIHFELGPAEEVALAVIQAKLGLDRDGAIQAAIITLCNSLGSNPVTPRRVPRPPPTTVPSDGTPRMDSAPDRSKEEPPSTPPSPSRTSLIEPD